MVVQITDDAAPRPCKNEPSRKSKQGSKNAYKGFSAAPRGLVMGKSKLTPAPTVTPASSTVSCLGHYWRLYLWCNSLQ